MRLYRKTASHFSGRTLAAPAPPPFHWPHSTDTLNARLCPEAETGIARRRAAHFATSVGFDNLISLPLLHEVELLPHQLKTALTVLRRFMAPGQASGTLYISGTPFAQQP